MQVIHDFEVEPQEYLLKGKDNVFPVLEKCLSLSKTLIPMQQFTDRTDLRIDRFAEDYFIFHLEDRHMLIISGEKEIRSEDEVYELETAPIKVNDDILIPFKLAKSFLEDDVLDLLKLRLNS